MIEKSLQYLFGHQFYFAAFRVPNEKKITTFVETHEANNQHFFKLQSFNSKKEIKISADFIATSNQDHKAILNIAPPAFGRNTKKLFIPKDASKDEFETYVSKIVTACKKTELEKAVAARTITKPLSSNFNAVKMFLKLCEKYPTAFVHFSVSEAGVWMGATPEILITKNRQNYTTVSLAGTKKIVENRAWTAKEIEEQAIVTRYILSELNEKASNLSVSEVETIEAGKIAHLKTTITFESSECIEELAQLLHPTPAVCGLPKQKAFEIISENEKENRSFYTGFLGFKEKEIEQYYVNLRCMQIVQNKAVLYVGAGITKDSEPNKEWEETEAKAQTLGSFLQE